MAGATTISPALVLGTLRYGETSRIVRLATRDLGLVSAIAKGALRPRSRFGAALQLFSEGAAHLIPPRTGELFTLAAFDVRVLRRELAGDLDRFSAANVLAELATRFVPAEPHPELFEELGSSLDWIAKAPRDSVGVIGLRALWRLVATLGLAPAVEHCARDGRELPEGPVAFSWREGGFLCSTCARAGDSTTLDSGDRADLVGLINGADSAPLLSSRQMAAHRRLLGRWVREHLADSRLPALEGWEHGELEVPGLRGSAR